ncbi:MAG: zinc ribbon domain-containing protein [Verrucomicrobiota bacterium]
MNDSHAESAEAREQQLCVSCMAPNEPEAHFCVQCGAPLSSYASTGPFESLFAEGSVYRKAAERPQKLIVVLGIWVLFGLTGLGGAMIIVISLSRRRIGEDWYGILTGAAFIAVSVAMIFRTTANYIGRNRQAQQHAPDSNPD